MLGLQVLLFLYCWTHPLVQGQDGPFRCICQLDLRPVCGVDGRNYPNICTALCKKALIACQHKCPCQEMTEPPTTTATTTTGTAAFQIEGDQTIDTNGVEASESVETDLPFFAGLEEAERPSEEPEEQPIDSCQCPDKYDPVCGVNEITYENPCEIKCDNVTQLCLGRCPCDANDDAVLLHACTCPDVFDLVCGKNGETYQSECFAGCKEVSIDCNGKCPCARFKRLDESQGNPALTGAFD